MLLRCEPAINVTKFDSFLVKKAKGLRCANGE